MECDFATTREFQSTKLDARQQNASSNLSLHDEAKVLRNCRRCYLSAFVTVLVLMGNAE
jgi:hypothetical protein